MTPLTQQTITLVVGFLLSALTAVSVFLAGRNLAVGWLVGLAVQVCWVVFAFVNGTWTLVLGPVVVGPVFFRNWLLWRRRDAAKRQTTNALRVSKTAARSAAKQAKQAKKKK